MSAWSCKPFARPFSIVHYYRFTIGKLDEQTLTFVL
jgi:hypothetical protein